MSIFETITTDIHDAIDRYGDGDISPTTVALHLQGKYARGKLRPEIAYSSLEHLKQMARAALRRRFDKATAPELDQGELFSGDLQERYPVPTRTGDDPIYKRLEALTEPELMWNEKRLGKSAEALEAHRRALRAYRKSRFTPANDHGVKRSRKKAA